MAHDRIKRLDVLVISQDPGLLEAFRKLPSALRRPVRIHRYATLIHPAVLEVAVPWAVICLDVDGWPREAEEAWEPIVRRITQRYPHVKWVACGKPKSLPPGLYVHQWIIPPWTPERLAAVLKPLLFPVPEVQAAIASPQVLPPRPEWLTEEVSREHLREAYERLPVKGVGWYDFRVGPLLWEGEVWPSLFRPHPPTPSDVHLERYAWWSYEGEAYWFYAVPVFQHTWLVAWGAAPFPHRSLQEHFAALRDAFQHLEPEPKARDTGPGTEEEFPPEQVKPLFDDVPPPFPHFPFGY